MSDDATQGSPRATPDAHAGAAAPREPFDPAHGKGGGAGPWVALVLALAAAGAIGWGVKRRLAHHAEIDQRAQPAAGPRAVRITRPRVAPGRVEVTLPGSAQPAESAALYARATGFLHHARVDLGDRVRRGQLLAVIEAPEVADQLRSARARRTEALATLDLARRNHQRVAALVQTGAAPAQAEEDAMTRVHTAQGAADATRADLERLTSLAAYLRVTAPFDGTVTRRYVDEGALVTAGTTRLFDLATTGRLEVQVDVPQWLAASVRPGVTATVTPREGGGAPVQATVTRTAGALDPQTRTLHVELALPDGAPLLAGAYANVRFALPRPTRAYLLPATTLAPGADGVAVWLVGEGDRVRRAPIVMGRDLGREFEVSEGVAPDARVMVFPPSDLMNGEAVRVVSDPPADAAAAAAARPGGR